MALEVFYAKDKILKKKSVKLSYVFLCQVTPEVPEAFTSDFLSVLRPLPPGVKQILIERGWKSQQTEWMIKSHFVDPLTPQVVENILTYKCHGHGKVLKIYCSPEWLMTCMYLGNLPSVYEK